MSAPQKDPLDQIAQQLRGEIAREIEARKKGGRAEENAAPLVVPFILWTILDVLQTVVRQQHILIEKVETLMATLAEFETRLKKIDDNTTASAAAAQALKKGVDELKALLAGGGLPAALEAQVLARLDVMGDTSAALKVFLEATAAGASEPVPVPVPEPLP